MIRTCVLCGRARWGSAGSANMVNLQRVAASSSRDVDRLWLRQVNAMQTNAFNVFCAAPAYYVRQAVLCISRSLWLWRGNATPFKLAESSRGLLSSLGPSPLERLFTVHFRRRTQVYTLTRSSTNVSIFVDQTLQCTYTFKYVPVRLSQTSAKIYCVAHRKSGWSYRTRGRFTLHASVGRAMRCRLRADQIRTLLFLV